MKMFKKVLFLSFFITTISLHAQDIAPTTKQIDKITLGIGLGQDYGGIGVNALYYPITQLGVFGGVGYAFAGVGYNVGGKFRFISKTRTTKVDPYILAMYGYNAAIAVKNATQYNKIFNGPTFGVGLDFQSKAINKGYWTLALLVPIRGSEVDQYMDDLEKNHGIEFKNKLLPIGFSIGYRFKLD